MGRLLTDPCGLTPRCYTALCQHCGCSGKRNMEKVLIRPTTHKQPTSEGESLQAPAMGGRCCLRAGQRRRPGNPSQGGRPPRVQC